MDEALNRKAISRRTFLQSACATAGMAALAGPARAEQAQSRPNILYIVLDEWGYYEMSCLGHDKIQTPVIDRLVREGMRLTNLYAGSSVCAPTRCSLMTGLHAGHMSLRTNGGWEPIRADDVTVASLLKRAGYAAGGFGKWGCGGRGTTGVPEKHGFDVFFGYYDQVHAHSYFPPYLIRNSREVPLEGNDGDFHEGKTFSQKVIFDQARQFIRDNRDKPFFCYCPWTPPHGQWGMDESDPAWQKFKDKPWTAGMRRPEDSRMYAAMLHLVDRQVGELLDLLKELGIADRTMVVVTGDNGGFDYFTKDLAAPDKAVKFRRGFFAPNVDPRTGKEFRGCKGDLYEGGLKVPAVAYWPGKIKAGSVSDHVGYFPDILPTLVELTGAPPPERTDGLSILPTLLGQGEQKLHDYLYWELGGQRAVRQGKMKAVLPRAKGAWELYDLAADPGEQENLAAKQPELLENLKKRAAQCHEDARPGQVLDKALRDKDQELIKPSYKRPVK